MLRFEESPVEQAVLVFHTPDGGRERLIDTIPADLALTITSQGVDVAQRVIARKPSAAALAEASERR